MLFLVAAVPLLFGVAVIVAGLRRLTAGRRFRRRAQRAHGVVTEIRHEFGDRLDRGGPPLRRAIVRFTTRDGRELETPMQIATSMDALRAADPVLVLYDPDDPSQAQLERHRGTDVVVAAVTLFVGFVLVAAGTLGLGIAAIASDAMESFEHSPPATSVTFGDSEVTPSGSAGSDISSISGRPWRGGGW